MRKRVLALLAAALLVLPVCACGTAQSSSSGNFKEYFKKGETVKVGTIYLENGDEIFANDNVADSYNLVEYYSDNLLKITSHHSVYDEKIIYVDIDNISEVYEYEE